MDSENSISQINELEFRKRYVQELQSKRQRNGYNELRDEVIQVNQQMLRTPGRRGEEIKIEEIEKEVLRRYLESAKYRV